MNSRQHEEIVRNWREYNMPFATEPHIVRAFTGGKTNQSYLLQADSKFWVLRVGSGAEHLGVNRAREFAIHSTVAEIGLAPRVLYQSSEPDFWITEYIEGEIYANLSHDRITALLDALAKVQRLPLDLPVFDYNQQLRNLSAKDRLDDVICRALETLDSGGTIGLCHHDLNPNNVIFSGNQPMLIDWEYAAVGLAEMDLASALVEWKISAQKIASLTGVNSSVLGAACVVYRALCRYWEQRQVAGRDSY